MIKKTFKIEIKAIKEEKNRATFDGYASTFGNIDLDNDIIQKGAFIKSLAAKGEKFPILVDHSPSVMKQAGWNIGASEDENGLMVKGELNLDVEAGKTAYSLMKQANEHGIEMGLSVGFMTKDSDYDQKTDIRTIKEIDLFEYSIVVFAANPEAGVIAVKELKEPEEIAIKKRELETILRDAGCSKSEAQKGVSAIFCKSDSDIKEFINLLNF